MKHKDRGDGKILIIIATFILGAVILILLDQPPIASSLLFASGIATLVYHFLGGITNAEFNMGPVKLGGSIAALIASAWFINEQLEVQQFSRDQHLTLSSKREILNDQGQVLGILQLDGKRNLGQNKQIQLNDSISLGKLELGSLKLFEGLKVKTEDKVELGTLEPQELLSLGFFKNLSMDVYTEIKYDLKLSPFDKRPNAEFWEPPHRSLQNSYNKLPFEVIPMFIDGSDRTVIKYKGSEEDHELEPGSIFTVKLRDENGMIYFVRVRNLARNKPTRSWKNFVVYQIMGVRRESVL